MGYILDKDGIKDIKYCDYVEIIDVNDDEYIYNVFYIFKNSFAFFTAFTNMNSGDILILE